MNIVIDLFDIECETEDEYDEQRYSLERKHGFDEKERKKTIEWIEQLAPDIDYDDDEENDGDENEDEAK